MRILRFFYCSNAFTDITMKHTTQFPFFIYVKRKAQLKSYKSSQPLRAVQKKVILKPRKSPWEIPLAELIFLYNFAGCVNLKVF